MKNKSNYLENKSRRSFIKKTSIATGAIVTSPLFVEAMSNVHAEKKLKVALETTNRVGAVRVTPNTSASGQIYVLGKIIESNGYKVKIKVKVGIEKGNGQVKMKYQ